MHTEETFLDLRCLTLLSYLTSKGVQRGEAPLAGVWGCPPKLGELEGVEKGLINNLLIKPLKIQQVKHKISHSRQAEYTRGFLS
jgi:hypothetical protein